MMSSFYSIVMEANLSTRLGVEFLTMSLSMYVKKECEVLCTSFTHFFALEIDIPGLFGKFPRILAKKWITFLFFGVVCSLPDLYFKTSSDSHVPTYLCFQLKEKPFFTSYVANARTRCAKFKIAAWFCFSIQFENNSV